MTNIDHEQIRELLGAFAVGAVDDDEARIIEAHLASCRECRLEIDAHVEAAAFLGSTPGLPPEHVWDRISEQLGAGPPPLRLQVARPDRRASPARRWVLAVAAALVLAVGAVGVTLASTNSSTSDSRNLARSDEQRLTDTPGAHLATLVSTDGSMNVNAVLLPDGRGYVFAHDLPALPGNQTYQLWAVMDDVTISAGLLGNQPNTADFLASGSPSALAISVEPKTGSVAPSTTPVVSGTVRPA